jgi:hypothetical protein
VILLASLLLGSPLMGFPDRLAGPVSNLVTLVNLLAFGLLIRSKRYFQTSADALLDVDRRAPILFLRSFEDDERVKFGSEQQHLLDFSVETRLANHLMRFGPFIAIGSPLDKVPQIGAARAKLSDDAWQGVVLGWARRNGLFGNCASLPSADFCKNSSFSFPPKDFAALRAAKRAARGSSTCARRSRRPNGLLRSRRSIARTVRAITFAPHGSGTLIRSKFNSKDANHLAALLAHDRMPASAGIVPADSRPAPSKARKIIIAGLACALLMMSTMFVPIVFPSWCSRNAGFCPAADEAAPSRVARATAAAEEFLAFAGNSPAPPRMSEPAVQTLLAAAFDTSALRNDAGQPPALREVAQWFDALEAVYSYYLLFSTGYSHLADAIDATSQNADVENRLAANAVAYAPEFGLGLDAQMAVLGRFAELLLPLGEKGRGSQAIMRNLLIDIWAIFVPAVDDGWRRERLQAVVAAAPSAAKSLLEAQREFLRNFAKQGADAVANPEIRTKLLELSAIFAAPQ